MCFAHTPTPYYCNSIVSSVASDTVTCMTTGTLAWVTRKSRWTWRCSRTGRTSSRWRLASRRPRSCAATSARASSSPPRPSSRSVRGQGCRIANKGIVLFMVSRVKDVLCYWLRIDASSAHHVLGLAAAPLLPDTWGAGEEGKGTANYSTTHDSVWLFCWAHYVQRRCVACVTGGGAECVGTAAEVAQLAAQQAHPGETAQRDAETAGEAGKAYWTIGRQVVLQGGVCKYVVMWLVVLVCACRSSCVPMSRALYRWLAKVCRILRRLEELIFRYRRDNGVELCFTCLWFFYVRNLT